MHGAAFALVVNIAVASLFATSFAIIAFTNPTHRSVYGFSVSYAIGMVTPLSELLLPLSAWPSPFMISSYVRQSVVTDRRPTALCREFAAVMHHNVHVKRQSGQPRDRLPQPSYRPASRACEPAP